MTIDTKTLQDKRAELKQEFDDLSMKTNTIEKELLGFKNNLNALFGAITQIDNLIKVSNSNDKKKDGDEKILLNEEIKDDKDYKGPVTYE
mgnify:FL=1|tara:strand:+ start:151 stop:420 length:270 start_codon:yes stop_codon:yes gene_type:complete